MQLSPISLAITRLGGVRFSPSALFSSGEQGAWYDPSDSATLFSDTAGTTPCAAPGAGALVNVGLMLDKSKGLVLGPELASAPFTDSAIWLDVVSNIINRTATSFTTSGTGGVQLGGSGSIVQNNKRYRVAITWTKSDATTAFSVRMQTGIDAISSTAASGVFLLNENVINGTVYLRLSAAATLTITSISVRELPGNHAISYNATTARPELSARVNLLTYSEEFDNAVWQKLAAGTGVVPVVTPNAGTAPDGTLTADRVVFNRGAGTTGSDISYLNQTITSVPSDSTGSIWLRTFDGSNQTIVLRVGNTFNYAVAVTGTWTRFSLTGTAPITRVDLLSYGDRQPQITDLLIWGADLRPANIGANVPVYQRIADQYTYDTVGFPRYLRFDGVDDGMSTPANLNLSATDKATVFAGVRKLSDAAVGVLTELSNDNNTNNGTFAAYIQTNGRYTFISKGTVASAAQSASFSAPVPITNVISGLGDISGDSAILRVNGAQAASSTSDQGTGNYGTYPLYIGARNNASLWFNGYIYSLIAVGAAATAAQISSTESWIAGKEGITL